jgi:hypothetical protein
MPRKIHRLSTFILSLAAAGLLMSCGGGSIGESASTVTLTDPLVGVPSGTTPMTGDPTAETPVCSYHAVHVTVRVVRAHQSSSASASDAGWLERILPEPQKINLLDLSRAVLEDLVQSPLLPETYQQVRFLLEPNSPDGLYNFVMLDSTTAAALATPSGVETGVKLVIKEDSFDAQDILQFDPCKAVVVREDGGYGLKPVL